MEALIWVRQVLLLAHALAFALALATVLREDWAVLRSRQIDTAALARASRTLTWTLLALWVSGLALMGLQVGFDAGAVVHSPKLAAKLLVVTALTANGLALHVRVFPQLLSAAGALPRACDPRIGLPPGAIVLGAISTASWLVASFIGLSRAVAPSMRLADYLALYLGALALAIPTALLWLRPKPPDGGASRGRRRRTGRVTG